MRKFTKTAGLLFLATSAVYSDQVEPAIAGSSVISLAPETPATEVKLLDGAGDPFSEPAAATKPVTEGQSVSDSEVKVSDAGTVEIHVNDASLVEVLRMLSLQSQKNIVASKDVRGTVTANLYDVTVREALDAILHANGYAYREQGNFIYVYTAKELADIEKASRVMKTEVFRLHYTPAANAVNMIKPVLSVDSQTAITVPAGSGVESGTETGGDGHSAEDIIVVTDFEENLDRVREILKEVDRRPEQILVEAVILRAALTEDNALGVDFTILGGVDFAGLTGAGSNTGQALNGGILNNASASGVVENGYNGAGTNFTNGVPNGGLKVGFVSSNIAVFISALEQVTDTVVMANPKVMALNKQRAEVHVGRNDGYLTTTTTESSTVQTVEFLETGTKLIFRPYIGTDGFIRMEVHPEDSNGGLNPAGLPFKFTTEVTSNVMVRDGHTIVIGGLFRESSSTASSQVPVLGNLPLVGTLFRNQRDNTTREEVIILLTPHIIKDENAYADASMAELIRAEKLRVGLREGMMFFGRERLAESCYESAVKEMNKPNPNRKLALWHLSCATNLNPKFIEAIEMRERLTGQEVYSVDNSTIRYFVRQQILAEHAAEPTTAPTTVPVAHDFVPSTQPVAQAPATQPLLSEADAPPATQPVAEVPSTQPVAQVPATQPIAELPITQPVTVEVIELEPLVEAPATQPVAAAQPTTMPATGRQASIFSLFPHEFAAMRDELSAAGPTTQPGAVETTVTELPFEEIGQGEISADNNK